MRASQKHELAKVRQKQRVNISRTLHVPMVAYLRAVGLIVAGMTALVYLIPAAPMTGDGQHYIEFVRINLQHGTSSWHERRLLGPILVRAMPLDAQDGFFVLTTVSLAVTALLTWLAARALLGGDELRALLAIPLLFGTWVVAPSGAERRRAPALLAIGVAAPAILVAVGLTLIFPGSGTDAGAYVFDWVRKGLFSDGVGRAAFLLFASYAALWLLLPRAWAGFP